MKAPLHFTNLTLEKRLLVNHIPIPTLYECRKTWSKRHLQTLSLIYPFAIHLVKNVFASHHCLAPPFLTREELAPGVISQPSGSVRSDTSKQARLPQHPSCTKQGAQTCLPPCPLCPGLAGPTGRHAASSSIDKRFPALSGQSRRSFTSPPCEGRF